MSKIALIMGAGDGLGAGLAKEFARHNLTTVVCRREKSKLDSLVKEIQATGQQCYGYGVDASNEQQMKELVENVEKNHGPIEVGIYNAKSFLKKDALDTTVQEFENQWKVLTLGAFIFGKYIGQRMVERSNGTLLFTGATSALRGSSGFSSFASSKAGLRNYTQSLARELGPKNVHVGHVIVDGLIDSEQARGWFKDVPQDKLDGKLLYPENLASAYWYLHSQPRNAWTYEIDIRPFEERW